MNNKKPELDTVGRQENRLSISYQEPTPGNYTHEQIKNHLEIKARNRYKKNNIKK